MKYKNPPKGNHKKVEKDTVTYRKRTRLQMGKRLRCDSNRVLKMFARLIDKRFEKEVVNVKVQAEDAMFGYETYTWLTKNDFERVFCLDEITGAVVTCFMM